MTAKELRDRAEECRIIAGYMQTTENNSRMLDLALTYELIARARTAATEATHDHQAVEGRGRVSAGIG